MLICLECQLKNPNSNKFCQHCGNSLTYTNCHSCGAEISLVARSCDRCGTSHAKQLTALVVVKDRVGPQPELVNNLAVRDNNKGKAIENNVRPSKLDWRYLDSKQRYYLSPESKQIVSLVFPESSASVIQTQIVDRSPLQESYLDRRKKQRAKKFRELEQKLSNWERGVARYGNNLGVPTIALPYLALQDYAPIVPAVYDTWYKKDTGILLLSDRSDWELLTDLYQSEAVPWELVLWSLNQMLKLWTPLVKVGCATTLLIEDNLRIDEDQSFGFQQLYRDPQDYEPTLAHLATKWQEWLGNAAIYPPQLKLIIDRAIASETTIEELHEALSSLAPLPLTIAESPLDFQWLEEKKDLFTAEGGQRQAEDLKSEEPLTFDSDEIDSLFHTNEPTSEDQPTAILAMEIASVTEASCTDVGSQRERNEDFFGTKTIIIQEENPSKKTVNVRGLYLVCDGMGGHSAGEVASAMAVETLQSYFYTYWQDELPNEETIKEGILLANRTIYQTNLNNNCNGNGMMGTTLVMALLHDNHFAIAHIGDSRIYRVTRKGGLEQLTQDHEVGQREINRGVEPEIAYGRPDAYQLTQALGPRDSKYIKPAIDFLEIQEDCLLLLCSDGMSDNDLLEKHWETHLKPLISSSADLQSGLFKLIDFADRYNGHDNITGILLRIKLQPNFEA